MKTNRLTLLIAVLIACFAFSCKEKDEHIPPNLSFKTTSGYTSEDDAVSTSTVITFGVEITKTEDDMKTLNVSHQFDGGSSVSDYTYTLSGSQQQYFSVDYPITTRSVSGTEKYIFTVTDNDGNITSRSITLTVN